MTNKRCVFVVLVLVVTAMTLSACFLPPPASPTEEPVPTATSQPPATSPPTSAPLPTDTPEPTDTPPPEPTIAPTQMPTTTSEPTLTPLPRPPKSEGPLDFKEPTWIHEWTKLPDGNVKVVVKVEITGGAPPFTVYHDGALVGKTWERECLVEFLKLGCSGAAHTITVESADGQSLTKDYWIDKDMMEWCK
jgi:hypothetical protein